MRFYFGRTLQQRYPGAGRTHVGVSTGLLGFTGLWWGAILLYWLIGMVVLAILVPFLAIALAFRAASALTGHWPRVSRPLNMVAGLAFAPVLLLAHYLERL